MNPFWSQIACALSPHVPGEQPRIANLVKLNTNESPFGPSPLAPEAMRAAAADTLRLYPDPEATELREGLAAGEVIEALVVWYRRKPRRSYATTNNRERHHHA
jgi:histidinol-phosphate aminotransferase